MFEDQRIHSRTPESRAFAERVQVALELTSRLNWLPYDELENRREILGQILGRGVPETTTILPPFYCDYGLNTELGEKVFVNQLCHFSDVGGITIGDRTMIGPRVTLSTSGHPVDLAERYDGITHAPIVIEDDVWIGAAVTVTQGVTIGRGSVVGAGTVVARDVPPMSVVTGNGFVRRKTVGE